jgi:hypothetical protein
MDKEGLIDRGDYYEIANYEPVVECDADGNVISVICCPYIPKFLVDGDAKVSTGLRKCRGQSV